VHGEGPLEIHRQRGFCNVGELLGDLRQGACMLGGHDLGTRAANRASPLTVDFDGDRTLQQADRDYQAIDLVRVGDDAFHTRQRAALEVHPGADAEEGPRLRCKPGTKDCPDRVDFFVVDREGGLARAHDAYHTGGSQNGQAVAHIKSTEQITWEKR
jgi:hypothetical protein